jgi:hypothetical protein
MALYLNSNITFKCDVVMTSIEDDFILLDTTSGLIYAKQFLQQCSPTLHPHLKKPTVCAGDALFYPNAREYMEGLVKVIEDSAFLSRFCRAHPQVTILVRLPGAQHESGFRHFFGLHYMLARNVRPTYMHILQLSQDYRASWSADNWITMTSCTVSTSCYSARSERKLLCIS